MMKGYRDDELGRTVETKTCDDGTEATSWYRNGKLHRDDDKPAVIGKSGENYFLKWYRNGKLHRDNGPAWVEGDADGCVLSGWYRDGKLHREDGAAIVKKDVDERDVETLWYIDGEQLESCKDYVVVYDA